MTERAFYRSCIQKELARRCVKNPRYSLRAFSRALGFEATVISQILSGKRVPALKTAQRLVKELGLSPDEQDHFFVSLAETHRARGLERLNPYFKDLESKNSTQKELSTELFRVIADWYHYAILALTMTRDFQPSPKWIAQELGISEIEAKLAIDRLIDLGFLAEKDGHLECTTEGFTTADKQLTTAALRTHQKQILENSILSLENDPIETRSHTSMTMAIDPRKLSTAKMMVEEFTQRLSKFLESGKRTQVYELGVSLYPVQKKGR